MWVVLGVICTLAVVGILYSIFGPWEENEPEDRAFPVEDLPIYKAEVEKEIPEETLAAIPVKKILLAKARKAVLKKKSKAKSKK